MSLHVLWPPFFLLFFEHNPGPNVDPVVATPSPFPAFSFLLLPRPTRFVDTDPSKAPKLAPHDSFRSPRTSATATCRPPSPLQVPLGGDAGSDGAGEWQGAGGLEKAVGSPHRLLRHSSVQYRDEDNETWLGEGRREWPEGTDEGAYFRGGDPKRYVSNEGFDTGVDLEEEKVEAKWIFSSYWRPRHDSAQVLRARELETVRACVVMYWQTAHERVANECVSFSQTPPPPEYLATPGPSGLHGEAQTNPD